MKSNPKIPAVLLAVISTGFGPIPLINLQAQDSTSKNEQIKFGSGQTLQFKNPWKSLPLQVVFTSPSSGRLAVVGQEVLPGQPKQGTAIEEAARRPNLVCLFAVAAGAGNQPDPASSKVTRYRITYDSTLGGALFSPDGRYLLTGMNYDGENRWPIVLDTESKRFKLAWVGDEVIALAINPTWSPDSRYISYLNTDAARMRSDPEQGYDLWHSGDIPVTLYVEDWRDNIGYPIADVQGPVTAATWLNSGTVLYGSLPQEPKRQFDLDDIKTKGRLPRPNLYTFDLQTRTTRMLIKDGFQPSPSPDGSKVAFFGSRDVDHPIPLKTEKDNPWWLWRYLSTGASLCVSNADGSGRRAIQPFSGLYPRILWLPDNRRLVYIYLTKDGPESEAEVVLCDTQTLTLKKLATLHASDDFTHSPLDPGSHLNFPFYPKGCSVDGTHVYVSSVSYKSNRFDRHSTEVLQSIDIATGKLTNVAVVSNLANYINISNLDWVDSAAP